MALNTHHTTDNNNDSLGREVLNDLRSAALKARLAAVRFKNDTSGFHLLTTTLQPESNLFPSMASPGNSDEDSVYDSQWSSPDVLSPIIDDSSAIEGLKSEVKTNDHESPSEQIHDIRHEIVPPTHFNPATNEKTGGTEAHSVNVRTSDKNGYSSLLQSAKEGRPPREKVRHRGSKMRSSLPSIHSNRAGEMVFRAIPKKNRGQKRHSLPGSVTSIFQSATVNGYKTLAPELPSRSYKDVQADASSSQSIDCLGSPLGPFRRWISPKSIAEVGLQNPLVYQAPSTKSQSPADNAPESYDLVPPSLKGLEYPQTRYCAPCEKVIPESVAMAEASRSEIFPLIHEACSKFQHVLSAQTRKTIEETCAIRVLSPELRIYLRENNYHLNESWKRAIALMMDMVLDKEARVTIETKIGDNYLINAHRPVAPVTPVACMGSKDSPIQSGSPDISLLGPGQESYGGVSKIITSNISQYGTSTKTSLRYPRNLQGKDRSPASIDDYVRYEATNISTSWNKGGAARTDRALLTDLEDHSQNLHNHRTNVGNLEHSNQSQQSWNHKRNTCQSDPMNDIAPHLLGTPTAEFQRKGASRSSRVQWDYDIQLRSKSPQHQCQKTTTQQATKSKPPTLRRVGSSSHDQVAPIQRLHQNTRLSTSARNGNRGLEPKSASAAPASVHAARRVSTKSTSGESGSEWTASSESSSMAPNLIHHVSSVRTHSMASLLRQRELGSGYWSSSPLKSSAVSTQIRLQNSKALTYWRGWTGVSKDVLTVAWSPNGSTFAIGGSTDLDDLNLQYNRSNNLLLGDLERNTLRELPNHRVARPRPETIEYGDNSRQAVYDSVDPELYTTITSVSFDTKGDRMYTASYDKTVKIWDVAQKGAHACSHTLPHDAPVDHLAVSRDYGIFATAQMTAESSMRIYGCSPTSSSPAVTFSSPRASKLKLCPTGLQWGISPEVNHLLLAGFTEIRGDGSTNEREGDLFLRDVETGSDLKVNPSAQSVFDICWQPHLPVFAAATMPGMQRNLTDRFHTRSVIRTFSPLQGPSRIMEYECPASDVNDIKFHPFDTNYISVGCTNGVTYFYDYRRPDKILHKLRHGPVIDQLDEIRNREDQDTGVRLSLWDQDGQLFYTGSSDGTIKAWNIYGSTEDALVCNVAHFDCGVMCGAFSPDYTNLLVGLSKGAVQMLSSAPLTHPLDQIDDDSPSLSAPYETMTYIPAKQPPSDKEPSGVALSRELIASGNLSMHPTYGAGKGPLYDGPYAAYAHPEGEDPSVTSLLPDIRALQLDKHERKKGFKAGGEVSEEDKSRYREQKKLAHARNFLWYGISKDEEGEGGDEDKGGQMMRIKEENEEQGMESWKRRRESEGEGEGEGEGEWTLRKRRRRRSIVDE